MTAPAAPRIIVRTDGDSVYVRWAAVTSAASYNVYAGATSNPASVDGSPAAVDVGPDGRFQYVFDDNVGALFVHVTALNAGAEESAASNEVGLFVGGPGRSFGGHADPFGNDR